MLVHSIAAGDLRPLNPTRLARNPELPLAALAALVEVDPADLRGVIERPRGEAAALPAASPRAVDALDDQDLARTIYNMGSSLLTWVREIHRRGQFAEDARVIGLTSEGSSVVLPSYAAVSAAKATLEAISRAIAVEFASEGIRANVIQAGVVDTPALRAIPDHEWLRESTRLRNPFGRLTTPEDVANVISLLCTDEAAWINGAIIRVDGGEFISRL